MSSTTPLNPPPRSPSGQDEEEHAWIPLETQPGASSQQQQQTAETLGSSASHTAPSSSSSALVPRRTDSVASLRRKVELRNHLQDRLLHHPLQLLWSHFLWHLAQEFLLLDIQIRVAFLFLVVGVVSRIMVLSTCLWYPRVILLIVILVGSWIYMNPNDIPRRVEAFFDAIIHLPHRIPETLENLNPQRARILALALLFFPTILQVRTITFLTGVNAEGGGLVWNLMITIAMAGTSVAYLVPKPSKTARDVFQVCLITLYGSALWMVFRQWRFHKMPSLAAPFFLSTGTLLLARNEHDNMEWFSEIVRKALRHTLRDILAQVGTSVQEDEMLQLAMLRWIVDYWSHTAAPSPSNPPPSQPTGAQDANAQHMPQQELHWDELLPMLDVATNQMSTEVTTLQQSQPTGHGQSATIPETPAEAGSDTTPGNRRNSARPADDPLSKLHAMLASMNVDDRAKPAVAAYKQKVEEFPPTREVALVVSVTRRCPAFLAFLWQILVASMFQSFTTTMYISLMLMPLMGLEVLRIQSWAGTCEALSRRLDGVGNTAEADTTTEAASSETTPLNMVSGFLPGADPMTILLCHDEAVVSEENDTSDEVKLTIPTLLLVWRNVRNSVGALEASLTAARCVHTGFVAVDFAKNVMSLAEFGTEVSRHGWLHGLSLIAKEIVFDHGGDIHAAPRGGANATFTGAAVSAVQNSQRIAHNLGVLAEEDDNVGKIIGPIVGLFGFIGNVFNQHDNGDNNDNNNDRHQSTEDRGAEETRGGAQDGANDTGDSTKAQEAAEQFAGETVEQSVVAQPEDQGGVGAATASPDLETAPEKPAKADPRNDPTPAEEQPRPEAPETEDVPVEGSEQLGEVASPESPVSSEELASTETEAGKKGERFVESSSIPTRVSATPPAETHPAPSTQPLEVLEKASDVEPVDPPTKEAQVQVPDPVVETVESEPQASSSSKAPRVGSQRSETVIEPKDTEPGPESTCSAPAPATIETEPSMTDSSTKKPAEDEPTPDSEATASVNVEKLASVMELIAEAYEKSIIDVAEKNEFCMKLSANGNDSSFVLGMETTLRGLILETSHSCLHPDSEVAQEAVDEASRTIVPGRCTPEQVSRSGGSGKVNESTMSDDGWSPIVESVASEEAAIQPLDYSEKLANAVRTRDDLSAIHLPANQTVATVVSSTATEENDGIPTVASSSGQDHDADDDNLWVKVGIGGIAVLGAAVGGAFLAMNQDNQNNQDGNNNTRQGDQANRSSVTIERLDDDEESGNEWEATS